MKSERLPYLLVAVIVVQGLSAAFFFIDVFNDSYSAGYGFSLSLHVWIEAVATLGLIFAIVFELRYLLDILRRNAQLARNMKIASGALAEVIEEHFNQWALTRSERDVAMFAIKGLSNGEIAALRDTSEGTIKSHLNAVFRKAGVSGRGQLFSLLIEDLMADALIGEAQAPQG